MSSIVTSRKIAWVTGASSGIGEATAIELARNGWFVFITARREDVLKTISEHHENLIPMAGDITDLSRMKLIVETIESHYGVINLAILNAGTYIADPIENFSAANFKTQIDLNLTGTANCIEAIIPKFITRRSGHLAIVASVAGYRGLPKSLSYGPSKAALINMTEALAIEGKRHNIKVQLINPGFIKTPLTAKNDFPMPFLMDVNDAATILVRELSSSRFEITFPKVFSYLLKFIGLLPTRLYIALLSLGAKP
jgi:NADP-dependent 3-hydroxy acid dehydrogenase YdfG